MPPKKTFLLRLSPDLYDDLRRWAEEELRSVNGQVEFVLREAMRQRRKSRVDRQTPAAPHETGADDDSASEAPPTRP